MPKPLQYLILFLVLGTLSVFFYKDLITLYPSFNHSWTKSDRLALAYGFLDNNFNLFKPQTFNLITKGGVTGVDLALHEYIIAGIMKALGTKDPIIFRIYNLALSLIGLVFLFKLSKLVNQSYLKSLLVTLFAFSLPFLTYYQAGFIPSTNALATTFIGYYFYLSFRKKNKANHFYFALFFLLISALVRTTYSIFLFALFLEHIYYWSKNRNFNPKELGLFIVAFSTIIASNIYKIYLNKTYGTIFLNSLLPPSSILELKELAISVWKKWYLEFMTIFHYTLMAFSFLGLFFFIFKKKLRTTTLSLTFRLSILSLLAGFTFFVLMLRQFPAHDYYYIDSFYLGAILFFIAGFSSLPKQNKYLNVAQLTAAFLLVIGAIWGSKEVQIKKNSYPHRGNITLQNYLNSDTYLDSLGIARTAKILVIDGYSPNEPLLLMDRKGYSTVTSNPLKVEPLLDLDIDYVVQQNTYLPEVLNDIPSLVGRLKRFAANEQLSVFKIQPFQKEQYAWPLLTDKKPELISQINFESGDPEEGWYNTLETTEEFVYSGDFSGVITSDYGPTYVWEDHYSDFSSIVFEAFFYGEAGNQVKLVSSFSKGDKEISRTSFSIQIKESNKWERKQFLFKIPKENKTTNRFKIYIWNPAHQKIFFDDITLSLF